MILSVCLFMSCVYNSFYTCATHLHLNKTLIYRLMTYNCNLCEKVYINKLTIFILDSGE